MDPEEFSRMVTDVRNLNEALGSPRKSIYEEEETTVVIQRRCLRAARDIEAGTKITDEDIVALRPAPEDGLEPTYREAVIGRTASRAIPEGDHFTWSKL
jgi:N-acetylneuraminate synthase